MSSHDSNRAWMSQKIKALEACHGLQSDRFCYGEALEIIENLGKERREKILEPEKKRKKEKRKKKRKEK